MDIQLSLHEQTVAVGNVHSTLSKLEDRVQSIEQEQKSTAMVSVFMSSNCDV